MCIVWGVYDDWCMVYDFFFPQSFLIKICLVICCFSFHIKDLRRFFASKNYLAFSMGIKNANRMCDTQFRLIEASQGNGKSVPHIF